MVDGKCHICRFFTSLLRILRFSVHETFWHKCGYFFRQMEPLKKIILETKSETVMLEVKIYTFTRSPNGNAQGKHFGNYIRNCHAWNTEKLTPVSSHRRWGWELDNKLSIHETFEHSYGNYIMIWWYQKRSWLRWHIHLKSNFSTLWHRLVSYG